jgi:hypothetical protein
MGETSVRAEHNVPLAFYQPVIVFAGASRKYPVFTPWAGIYGRLL